MTKKEQLLAAALLNMAADTFTNHSCNEMDSDVLDNIHFTDEEKIALAKEYWGEDVEEEFDDPIEAFYHIGDSCWMDLLAEKLRS